MQWDSAAAAGVLLQEKSLDRLFGRLFETSIDRLYNRSIDSLQKRKMQEINLKQI
jgi:hypothetical protein